jgi:mRNA interferase RelE/StbE
MGNSLNIKSSAGKELDALPWRVQIQAMKAIIGLSIAARPEGCKKLMGSNDVYRIRIGEYRIIYKIDDEAQAVYIESAGHRQNIYKR